MGFSVEAHPVPADLVRANGMMSCTNLVVRVKLRQWPRPGDRAQCARRRRCRPAPAGPPIPTAQKFATEECTAEASRCRNPISRRMRSRCARSQPRLRRARSSTARSSCTSRTTRKWAGRSGRPGCCGKGSARPDFAISAGFSYAITTAHNGCLHLEVEVVGKSGHAAEPEKGVDALEAATAILSDLYALRKAYARRQVERARHRLADARGRTDRRRHQHQRRARPRELPHRPPDHSGRGSGRGRGDARRAKSSDSGARWPGITRAREAHPAGAYRSCRFRARTNWSPRSAVMARRSSARRCRRIGVPIYTDARHVHRRRRTDRAVRRRAAHARRSATGIAPTRISSSTTCTRRPKSSRSRSRTSSLPGPRDGADCGRRRRAAKPDAVATRVRARRRADRLLGHAVLHDRGARRRDARRSRRRATSCSSAASPPASSSPVSRRRSSAAQIDAHGGRRCSPEDRSLGAAACAALATAQGPLTMLAGWLLAGVAMAACLYDPAFATLHQIAGAPYRRAVTALTLFGGFASTVFWPLSQYLLDTVGWRATFAIYAGLHLVAVPAACTASRCRRRAAGADPRRCRTATSVPAASTRTRAAPYSPGSRRRSRWHRS